MKEPPQARVPGDPITPEARPYPPDAFGAEGVILIFNGPQWKQFGIPDPAPNHRYPQSDIAPPGDTKGLIYYRLDRFGRNQGQDARAKALAALAREGANATLPPAPSSSGNGGSSGGWGGLGWLAGGTGLAIGGQVVLGLVAPEAEAPILVTEGAPLLTRAMLALAA